MRTAMASETAPIFVSIMKTPKMKNLELSFVFSPICGEGEQREISVCNPIVCAWKQQNLPRSKPLRESHGRQCRRAGTRHEVADGREHPGANDLPRQVAELLRQEVGASPVHAVGALSEHECALGREGVDGEERPAHALVERAEEEEVAALHLGRVRLPHLEEREADEEPDDAGLEQVEVEHGAVAPLVLCNAAEAGDELGDPRHALPGRHDGVLLAHLQVHIRLLVGLKELLADVLRGHGILRIADGRGSSHRTVSSVRVATLQSTPNALSKTRQGRDPCVSAPDPSP